MRKLFLILLFCPTLMRAESKIPLIDIYLDEPTIQEQFRIFEFDGREELTTTSNGLFFPTQEFGRYVRKPSDLPAQIEGLEQSVKASGFTPPEQMTIEWPNWHVLIKGQEIDPLDPRFSAAFQFLNQTKPGGWSRLDVTVARLRWRPFQLSIAHLQYRDRRSSLTRPHVTRQTLHPFDTCLDTWGEHLVCRVPHGFILLSSPDEKEADQPRRSQP